MDPYSNSHQQDEGYSEDPLGPSVPHTSSADVRVALEKRPELQHWLGTLPVDVKTKLTMSLLEELPTSVVSQIVHGLSNRLYINFVEHLPPEVCLKILGYLDPVSLVSVLQTCRSWHRLAMEPNLWKGLYFEEGWRVVQSEVDALEERMRRNAGPAPQVLRIQSSEDSHASKVRPILHDDADAEMSDAAQSEDTSASVYGAPAHSFASDSAGNSIFGTAGFGFARAETPQRMDVDMEDTGKGKGKGKRKMSESDAMPDFPSTAPQVRSQLWLWDSREWRLNWKYLYNMRRRLEFNWELGKFTNFQLPHPAFPEEAHQECIYSLQFDDRYLVSSSRDTTLKIWDLRTRRNVRTLTGHKKSVLCLQFDASPEEDIIISGSSDASVIVWKFSTGEPMKTLRGPHTEAVLNVRFDKRILVTCSKDKTIKVFNRRPLRYGDAGYGPAPAKYDVDPVALRLKRYGLEPDLANELPVLPPFETIAHLDGHTAAVNAVQVHGNHIVSASGDRTVKVWDWTKQMLVRQISEHTKGIACVQFDGRRIVSGSSDNEVKVFDADTGLEVASLKAHTSLVRTVQAGFADLPWSLEEDELEARRVDARYFKAVENGEVEPPASTSRRTQQRNAGSSDPKDITATGAKIPPGGGGGKYGRIVSGSYDQTIIIWRRDKTGAWKPSHRLRQEDAATSAAAAPGPTPYIPLASPPSGLTTHPRSPASRPGIHATSSDPTNQSSSMMGDMGAQIQSNRQTAVNLIEQVIPQGVAAFQSTLARYPPLLSYHSHMHAVIDRQENEFTRSQLRQAVSAAMMRVQLSRTRNQAHESGAESADAAESTATQASGASGAPPTSHSSWWRDTVLVRDAADEPESASQAHSTAVMAAASVLDNRPPGSSSHAQPGRAARQHQQHFDLTQLGHTQPAVGHAQGNNGRAQYYRLPGVAAPAAQGDGTLTRVFKLQFDARRIICCSQTTVIVGWDFCNRDRELEEVSALFGAVE